MLPPFVFASIAGGGAPPPFRVSDMKLHVIIGRETERMNVRNQKVHVILGPETTRMNVRNHKLHIITEE